MNQVIIVSVILLVLNLVSSEMDGPIIGILAQESKPWDPNSNFYKSYITASYVKAVEASGGRIVPIFIDQDAVYYENLTTKLNGFLFPGGAADILSSNGYARSGKIIYNIVKRMNEMGDNIPILGVCLGMELLGLITSNGIDLRTPCSAKNVALNLNFLEKYEKSSLYKNVSKENINTLSSMNSTSNHHRYCLTQETLNKFNQNQWNILSTSTSHDNITFISSMEMRNQPIAAIIFHPEKNAYEWRKNQANPHDAKSISAARIFYDWLIDQSRRNIHSFDSETELQKNLIYNYNPVNTGKSGLYDTQDYYFNI